MSTCACLKSCPCPYTTRIGHKHRAIAVSLPAGCTPALLTQRAEHLEAKWQELALRLAWVLPILAEGAIALLVTLSGSALFAS